MGLTPRYSCIFVRRFCPRACSYCLARDVRGDGRLLKPEEWAQALHILESHGVVFHLILGNELFSYPNCVELVRELKPFHGRYAIYSTFPHKWAKKWLDPCIDAGLYNISGGVDVVDGIVGGTGDFDVDDKSRTVLQWLTYCKQRGVPDVHATVTIHRYNYKHLYPILDICTERGIWVALNLVEYSMDGKHDFYRSKEHMTDWLIPDDEREQFRDAMYALAAEMRTGRWLAQVPPSYFEEVGDRELAQTPWHCSQPVLINVEEDGMLRACGYRGPLKQPRSVFELGDGRLTMEEYCRLQRECTSECPGCGGGGGAWSYWWQSELYERYRAATAGTEGDRVLQEHFPGHEFEKLLHQHGLK